ncbi:hypothetical protein [Glutamicibacter sp.]|uniref:hypothetical protein n=1 Tax=Glutamicibacter sp. TaxID=1931995 RepID=UPI003D6B31F5
MKKRSKGQQVIAVSCLAVMAYLALYLFLRPQLPEQLVRHAGADGSGYGPTWLVVLVIGAVATLSIAIGIVAYRDFTTLGHWNPGPKSIVVCFLAAGFGILGLGAAMIFAAMGEDAAQLGSLPIGVGLLGLVGVFALSAGLLAKALPQAEQETLDA